MPYAYCTSCQAQVPTQAGLCPEGHPLPKRRGGKHRAPTNRRPLRSPRPAIAPVRPRPAAPLGSPIAYDSTLIEMFGFSETPPLTTRSATAVLPHTQSETVPGLPTLKEMRRSTDTAPETGALVTRLWDATETLTPNADWEPEAFDALATSQRTFRWPIIIAAVVVLIGGLSVIRWASAMPERATATASADYLAAATQLEADLGEARDTISVITDLNATTSQLSDAAVSLSTLDADARNLFDTAAEPLPSMLPLVSRSSLEALTPTRRAMANASEIGLTLERRLGDALSYRLAFSKAFRLPQLVTAASPEEISPIGVALGLAASDTRAAIEALPDEPFFADHLAAVRQLELRLDDWQVEYLGALRSGDETAAAALVVEIRQRVAAVQQGVQAPLATLQDWAHAQLSALQAQLGSIQSRLD